MSSPPHFADNTSNNSYDPVKDCCLLMRDIHHHYVGADGKQIKAVDNVTMAIPRGKIISLVGPSGCGKTTLLNIVAGIIKQQSGIIEIFGLTPEVAIQRGLLSFIFQEPALLPWRTVKENIVLPLELRHSQYDDSMVSDIIDSVLLNGRENSYPDELSGGMKSRVSLARALVTRPSLLLMDEPFGQLDEATARIISYELLELWEKLSPTIVMVTHNIQSAVFLSDRVFVMSARPGHIKDMFHVNLPRPRNERTLDDEDFFRISSDVRHSLDSNFLTHQTANGRIENILQ